MARVRPLALFQLAQNLDPKNWPGWSPDELAVLSSASASEIGAVLFSRLVAADFTPADFYAVVHDRDVGEDGAPVAVHIHVIARFPKGVAVPLARLAEILGVAPQYIEKAKRGAGAWDSFLAYLVHVKYADKFQYDPACVASLAGPSYVDIYAARSPVWLRARGTVAAEKIRDALPGLYSDAFAGRISPASMLEDPQNVEGLAYSLNQSKFDACFSNGFKKRLPILTEGLKTGVFSRSSIYITGASGSGKSRLADRLSRDFLALVRDRYGVVWSSFVSAASGLVLDAYRQEELCTIEETRSETFYPSMWLRVLDPEEFCTFGARYQNQRLFSFVNFLCSCSSLLQFCEGCTARSRTPLDRSSDVRQYLRRIACVIDVSVLPFGSSDEFPGFGGGLRSYSIGFPRSCSPYSVRPSFGKNEYNVDISFDGPGSFVGLDYEGLRDILFPFLLKRLDGYFSRFLPSL